jgi:hypothetical protein
LLGQMKDILSRRFLPDKYRLAIAKNIENGLFSRVTACNLQTLCHINTSNRIHATLFWSQFIYPGV